MARDLVVSRADKLRMRAEEVRAVAGDAPSETLRRELNVIADQYERLADQAETWPDGDSKDK